MIKILATVKDSCSVKEMDQAGVDMFRINMSHQYLDGLQMKVRIIRNESNKPICIDTEGSQVRTGEMHGDCFLYHPNTYVRLTSKIAGYNQISLPQTVLDQLKPGDIINDCIGVLECNFAKIIKGCQVDPNYPITVNRKLDIPAFTEKDMQAAKIGGDLNIFHYALSFTRCAVEVREFRKHLPLKHILISKIESQDGLNNLDEIIQASDAILIDRGDLSKEVNLKDIPMYQEMIINKCKTKDKPVYVATNFLESMCEENKPTIAEVNDVAATIKMGADGLVLAAETAIGKYPVETVKFVKELIERYG